MKNDTLDNLSISNFLKLNTENQTLPKNGTGGIIIACLPSHTRGPRRVLMNTTPQFVEFPIDTQIFLGDELKLHCR